MQDRDLITTKQALLEHSSRIDDALCGNHQRGAVTGHCNDFVTGNLAPVILASGGGATVGLRDVDFITGDKNEIHFNIGINITVNQQKEQIDPGHIATQVSEEVNRQMLPIMAKFQAMFGNAHVKFNDAVRNAITRK